MGRWCLPALREKFDPLYKKDKLLHSWFSSWVTSLIQPSIIQYEYAEIHVIKRSVSENSGFFPQIIHFNRVFHYNTPSILGVPLFLETPICSIPMQRWFMLIQNIKVMCFPRWIGFFGVKTHRKKSCSGKDLLGPHLTMEKMHRGKVPASSIRVGILLLSWWLKSGLTSWGEGSLSHYLQGFYTFQVVGNGISEPSTVASTRHTNF